MFKPSSLFLFVMYLLTSCGNPDQGSPEEVSSAVKSPTNEVLLSSEIVWEQLNPARGDQSPQAGTIWGDRKGTPGIATGFLAKFVDGFSSPPHIHNVTYRAVVIQGQIHNDDPEAENMWMNPGSFWTQPLGESHITSAKGEETIALVEIDEGPYLVKPVTESFDSGERAINIESSNVVWLDDEMTTWIESGSMAEISFLLESKGSRSLFLKLPSTYAGSIQTHGTVFHAVMIKGDLQYHMPIDDEIKNLDPGSYFSSTDRAIHELANNSAEEVILYLRTNGRIEVR